MTARSKRSQTQIPWSYAELVRAEYIEGLQAASIPVASGRAAGQSNYVEVSWPYRQLMRAA